MNRLRAGQDAASEAVVECSEAGLAWRPNCLLPHNIVPGNLPPLPKRHDIWRLDDVVITIHGKKRYLWRAVDQDGYVLDEIVQIHRNAKAARRLLMRLLRKQGRPPKRIITDKLGSYTVAKRTVMPSIEHRQHKVLNNRAEKSHVPV